MYYLDSCQVLPDQNHYLYFREHKQLENQKINKKAGMMLYYLV